MKVYFTGAHSSGKSTLCRYVSNKYNVPMITECARMVLSEKELQINTLRFNLDVVDDYQQQVFNRQLEEEKKYSSFVSDRSFDCLAYAGNHSRIFVNLLNCSELKTYVDTLRSSDVFIFFVRPCKATMANDGVRESPVWDGIITIDAQIKLLFEMFSLRYFQINTDSMQERARLIDSVLSLRKIT